MLHEDGAQREIRGDDGSKLPLLALLLEMAHEVVPQAAGANNQPYSRRECGFHDSWRPFGVREIDGDLRAGLLDDSRGV